MNREATETVVSRDREPSRKRKASEPDVSDISPKRRCLDTSTMKTAICATTWKKSY